MTDVLANAVCEVVWCVSVRGLVISILVAAVAWILCRMGFSPACAVAAMASAIAAVFFGLAITAAIQC